MSSSFNEALSSFEIIDTNSFHLKSVHDNVRQKVGNPNCLNIVNTSCKNIFLYASVPSIALIKRKVSSDAMNCFTVSLKFLLIKRVVRFLDVTFRSSIFIWLLKLIVVAQNEHKMYNLNQMEIFLYD